APEAVEEPAQLRRVPQGDRADLAALAAFGLLADGQPPVVGVRHEHDGAVVHPHPHLVALGDVRHGPPPSSSMEPSRASTRASAIGASGPRGRPARGRTWRRTYSRGSLPSESLRRWRCPRPRNPRGCWRGALTKPSTARPPAARRAGRWRGSRPGGSRRTRAGGPRRTGGARPAP